MQPATEAPTTLEVPVPDIGTEEPVDLIEVAVAAGDRVEEGDTLVVLESDKASMEVPAPAAGEIDSLLVMGDPLDPEDAVSLEARIREKIANVVYVGPFVAGAAESAIGYCVPSLAISRV